MNMLRNEGRRVEGPRSRRVRNGTPAASRFAWGGFPFHGSLRLCLLLVLTSATAQAEQETEARSSTVTIDPRAEEVLRSMSAYLGGVREFGMSVEETVDEFLDGGLRVQLSNLRRFGVRRPNRLAGDVQGDTEQRSVWYDGEKITLLDKVHNVYGVLSGVPATIDETLDYLAVTYDVILPVADLLYSDVFKALLPGVRTGTYAGLHSVRGAGCHHLVFTQDTVDWQIWIDAGSKPIPRKLVITYKLEEGHPQFQAVVTEWKEMSLPDEVFQFRNTTAAEKIDIAPMIEKAAQQ